MDNFTVLKSKLDQFLLKPMIQIEDKFNNDLKNIEEIKNIFYEIDISVTDITNEIGKKEKTLKKINSSLLINKNKNKNNNDRNSILKEETLFQNKLKINNVTPSKTTKKNHLNSSIDEKIYKTITKEKAVPESKKQFTRNINNNSSIRNLSTGKEKNTKVLSRTLDLNNYLNNEDKDILYKVKNTHENTDNKIINKKLGNDKLKKDGIDKLKRDLENKSSLAKLKVKDKSMRKINLSTDNIAFLDDSNKRNGSRKDKLHLNGRKFLLYNFRENSIERIIVNLNSKSKENTGKKLTDSSLKVETLQVPKSNNLFDGIKFKNKYDKCFTIFVCSNYLNDRDKFHLILNNKRLETVSTQIKKILGSKVISNYEKRIKILGEKLSNYINDQEIKEALNKQFIPSKTALNGLNFVKTLDENDLAKQELPEELILMIKLIYLLIAENYEIITPSNDLLQNLILNIYPKLQVDNLKTLFLDFIVKNTRNLSSDQLEKIVVFCENHSRILNSSEILKFNKPMSFLCFVIKETYEFIKQKTEDGAYLICLRRSYLEYMNYKDKVEILKKQL